MKTYRQIRPNLIPFVDYHTNLLLIFILILAFSTIIKKNDTSMPANVIYQVVLTWPGESNADIDEWMKDPEGRICGFNKREGGEGSLMALNHDSLGKSRSLQLKNEEKPPEFQEEIISLRGTVEGEYIVNAHCYLKRAEEPGPLTVKVKLVKIKPFKEIIVKERIFNNSGDEETFFRFKLDKNGEVLETNELPAKIAVINGGGQN